jgi:nucleoid DNA-binding protein
MAKAAPKKASAILPKPKDKGYTKGKLIAHLAAAVSAKGVGDLSKKQAAAVVEELADVLFQYAPVGAQLPGLGKLVLRQIPAKPARTIMSFGKEIQVKAKPKSQKLVFRFSKDAKARFAK